MTRVLGVDGCPGGWAAALVDLGPDGPTYRLGRLPHIDAALALDVEVVGVDMPMGLPESGRRACDLAAKRQLGRAHPRVFLAPPRAVLDTMSYDEARALHRRLVAGLSMSIQTWHLVERMREVDAVADDVRLVEVHPELTFAALAGQVLRSKHTREGRAQRITALESWLPGLEEQAVPSGTDDIDALAVAWSAARMARGEATVIPAQPECDALGRPMRIVV